MQKNKNFKRPSQIISISCIAMITNGQLKLNVGHGTSIFHFVVMDIDIHITCSDHFKLIVRSFHYNVLLDWVDPVCINILETKDAKPLTMALFNTIAYITLYKGLFK